MMNEIDKAIYKMRGVIFASFCLQASQCLLGAGMTSAGMYAILHNAPIMGGIFIILAFFFGREFVKIASSRIDMRSTLRDLHKLRNEIDEFRS